MKMNIRYFESVKEDGGSGEYKTATINSDEFDGKQKELEKQARELVKDIFDNYDKKYTREEKDRVLNVLNQMNELNISLDHHDEKTKKSVWDKFKGWFNNATGKKK